MVPRGYVGLVVCDTRRALQWERGLAAAGFEPLRVETTGDAADRGDWQLAVPDRHGLAARAYVSRVLQGEESLPHAPLLSRSAWISATAIAVLLAAILAVTALGIR